MDDAAVSPEPQEERVTLEQFLLPYQRRFAQARSRRRLFLSGRQEGKSHVMAYVALQAVHTSRSPSPLALAISTGARAASEFLKKCAQMAEALHILEPSITYQASADQVRFSTGARIVSLPSGNPAALRGWSADAVLIDEAAYIDNPEEVWAAIAPTLTRNPDALLAVASTPAGKASWFFDLYQKASADEGWYVQTTTIEDAVAEGLQVDLEALRSTIGDPDVWNREYMCQFASEYGALVDPGLLEFCDAEGEPRCRWMGMDVGSASDRTAIVTVAQLRNGDLYVEDATVLHKASYESQLETLKRLYEKYNWQSGLIDANGLGGPIAEFASKQVTAKIKGFTWTGTNKSPAYEALRARIFDRRLKFKTGLKELAVGDFSNVRRVVSEAGRVTYEAGRGANGHSDFTSALVLALQAQSSAPIQMNLPAAAKVQSVFGFNPMFSRNGASRLAR